MSDPPKTAKPPRRPTRTPVPIPEKTRAEIIDLHNLRYGTRPIANRVGASRKIVQRVLDEEGLSLAETGPSVSRLAPFLDLIKDKVEKRLTTSRILREITEVGYAGARTILAEHVRALRQTLALEPKKTVKRRFETLPGQEMQIDWSPYLVPIGGRPTKIHALGCLLCASRRLYLRFYADERQPTLLEGLASAFEYFDGVAHRVVLDNMATAVLGRIGPERKPLWHERFLAFATHYGFEPFACKVRDPDRKGKKEKSFRYLWDDFLKASDFKSWDDLDQRRRVWLDETPEVGNLRVHGTTRLVPSEAYHAEHPLLIRLPGDRFPVHEDGVRDVDQDATLSVRGTRYTVPAPLANRAVAVRLYAEHFDVIAPHGQVAFSRRYAQGDQKGKLQIDSTHYANIPRGRRASGNGERLDEAFLRRFPDLAPFVEGLTRRFKTLAPIHLRALIRTADRFGHEPFLAAARRAQDYRRFDALAIQRILERDPLLIDTAPRDDIAPLGGIGPAILGEVDSPSLDDYGRLDGPTPKPAIPIATPNATEENPNGA